MPAAMRCRVAASPGPRNVWKGYRIVSHPGSAHPGAPAHGHPAAAEARPEISLRPSVGWHCSHFFYRFDPARLAALGSQQIADGAREFAAILDPAAGEAPTRLQTFVVSGHKADFGFMALDGDPLRINRLHHRLLRSPLGSALDATWSFVSMTELSEYVPTIEHYGERLVAEGVPLGSEDYRTKLDAWRRRLEIMRRQRLNPDLSSWPAMCFYPMNKRRGETENWFLQEFARREKMMGQHGESGMKFAGRVTQLVTVAVGIDDWEWGVTLWARNPEFLTQIVYQMRFDEASARYGEFGPFYVCYQTPPAEILAHCCVTRG